MFTKRNFILGLTAIASLTAVAAAITSTQAATIDCAGETTCPDFLRLIRDLSCAACHGREQLTQACSYIFDQAAGVCKGVDLSLNTTALMSATGNFGEALFYSALQATQSLCFNPAKAVADMSADSAFCATC